MVLLNACFSRPQAEAITELIDCAVGMTRGIEDQAAITFAAAFYRAIGYGRSVQTAFDLGKAQRQLAALHLGVLPRELGHVSARDQYFIAGFRGAGFGYSYLNTKFVEKVLAFSREHLTELRREQAIIRGHSGHTIRL